MENENFVCLECEQCQLPMVVYKHHDMNPPCCVREQMKLALGFVADQVLQKRWYFDYQQRTVFHHLHWHARPAVFEFLESKVDFKL